MIDRKIRQALKEKFSSERTMYNQIKKKQKEHNYTLTKDQAACLLAAEKGIDISKILPPEELAALRMVQPQQTRSIIKKEISSEPQDTVKINVEKEFEREIPFLSNRLSTEAKEMAKIYPILYLFENSVRNLVLSIMIKKHGPNWWDSKATTSAKKHVEGRLKDEEKNRWHGKRGAHNIFYTDMEDLKSIIIDNWEDDFKEIFPNQQWFGSIIENIERSRNIVAHNNPLSKKDIRRIKINFDDWIDQVKKVYQESKKGVNNGQ